MSTLFATTTGRRPKFPGSGFSTTRSDSGHAFLAMPFDALRFQYASAVKAGLVPRSILASARAEQAIDRLEKLILGPLARQR